MLNTDNDTRNWFKFNGRGFGRDIFILFLSLHCREFTLLRYSLFSSFGGLSCSVLASLASCKVRLTGLPDMSSGEQGWEVAHTVWVLALHTAIKVL